MEDNILKYGIKLLLKQKRRKRWHKIVGFLACLVVFCTSYALILPAITMEKPTYCGKEEHIHDESCYEVSKSLICGLEEQTEPALTVGEAETSAVGEDTTWETETSGAAHVHTEECYLYEKILICTLEEHIHTKECYMDTDADAETLMEERLEEERAEKETLQVIEEENTKTLEAGGEACKVVVTYDESAGIPENAALKVSEYAQDSEEYQVRFEEANAVLLEQDGSCIRQARFFNISIMDGETEIEPTGAVRVEISQFPDIAENAEDIIITHATDEGTEVISEVEQTQEENGYVTISFETQSFSDYGTISAGQRVTIGIGDTVTLEGKSGNKNEWTVSHEGIVTIEKKGYDAVITGMADGTVIVTHKIEGNQAETYTVIVTEADGEVYEVTDKGNKKVLPDESFTVENNKVRLHKWAEATEIENEFLVHLSIDTTSVTEKYDEFLKDATYVAGSASHFPDGVVSGGLGNLQGSEKDTHGNKPYTITLTYQGKVVGTAVVNMEISNGCLYLKLNPNGGHNDTVYIALAELKKEQIVNTELSPEAYEILVKHVENTAYTDGLSVEDTMGPAIIYLDSASGDGTVVPNTAALEPGTKIIWTPKIKSGLVGIPDPNDDNKIWYENVAELTYRVKLDVTNSNS